MKWMIGMFATVLAISACDRNGTAQTTPRQAQVEPDEERVQTVQGEPTEVPMVRPAEGPTEMRPTNSPTPPNTPETRAGGRSRHN